MIQDGRKPYKQSAELEELDWSYYFERPMYVLEKMNKSTLRKVIKHANYFALRKKNYYSMFMCLIKKLECALACVIDKAFEENREPGVQYITIDANNNIFYTKKEKRL